MLVPRRHFLKQTPSRLVGVSQHYKQYDPRVVVVWLIGENGRRCLLCGCIFLFSEAVSSKFEVGLDKGGHRVTKSCHCKGPVTLTLGLLLLHEAFALTGRGAVGKGTSYSSL